MRKLILFITLISLCLNSLSSMAFAKTIQEEIIELATEQMKKNIEYMDESKDKSVSFAEYIAYNNKQALAYDADFNQKLTLEEYKQWVYGSLLDSASQNPQIRQQLESEKIEIDKSIEASFEKFDIDSNKFINTEELKAIHEHNMKNADLNKDQLLNGEDIQILKQLISGNE